ncbi:MAG: NAD(P)-binding domain-containing protein [Micropruina sp.]|uniref:flavin-containing monooxygenase n=1 Tax=Micropruina sp. TaxID=2737536 RepID=UPI0039E488F5
MKVCVVGAGPCGLTTIKQLRDEGHEVVCYDKNPDLGGIWLREGDDGHKMKAFDNLRLTISMKLMAYSDHPFKGGRVFYTRPQYLGYLNEYAEHFGLRDAIVYDSEVTGLTRTEAGWLVTVRHDGVETTSSFDAVAVCSGPFKTPARVLPELAGFTGEVVHSSQYRNNEPFRDKRVLVVGLAESGADIVREVSDVSSACTLAIRSYSFLLARVSAGFRSTDHGTVRAHHHEMYRRATKVPLRIDPFWATNSLVKAVFLAATVVYGVLLTAIGRLRRKPQQRPGANPFGEPVEPPKLDLGTLDNPANREMIAEWNRRSHPDGSWSQKAIFCKNVTFIPNIVEGRITLNDAGLASAQGNRVQFKDGSSDEFDIVLLCTGFTTEELAIGDLKVPEGDVRNLYKHFLPAEHRGTAAFIGFVRPFSGGIPICAEMQARYFAQLCSGKLRLPADVDQRIAQEKEWEEHWTSLSPRRTESVPSQILYLDSLAREIGCLVPEWRLILNPRLLVQLWFGSFNPSCYRIVGPHNLGAAALADLYSETVEDRGRMVLRHSLLQLMPAAVHPRDLE